MFGRSSEGEDSIPVSFEEKAWTAIRGDSLEKRAVALGKLASYKLQFSGAGREALALAESALVLFAELDDEVKQLETLKTVAACQAQGNNDFAASLETLEAALKIAQNLNDTKSIACLNLDIAERLQGLGQVEASSTHALEAATVFVREGLELDAAFAYSSAAKAEIMCRSFDQALEFARRALELFQEADETINVAMSFSHIADILIELKRFEEATDANTCADAIVEMFGIELFRAQVQFNRARILAADGLHAQAIEIYDAELVVFRDLGDTVNTFKVAIERAKSLSAMGCSDESALEFKLLEVCLDALPELVNFRMKVRGGV